MAYPKERLPAKQSKCPHCNWIGSSRGLFSHVRLTHPGMEDSLKIRSENPYVIKNNTVGSVKKKRNRFDTGESAIPKFNLDDAKTVLFMTAFVKLLNEYVAMDDNLFPSRSSKLNPRK